MREHIGLFRGKRIDNGEWVEGCLLKATLNGKTAHLIFGDNFSFVGNDVKALSHALVDPDTVGECTSLKDKNGKLIFEGDIVRCGTGRICKVTFFTSPGVSGFDLVAIGSLDAPPPHNWVLFADTEIIGTVHDNPELLKGGEG